MIATHNIKVNGQWFKAGEEIPEAKQEQIELTEVKEEKPVKELPRIVKPGVAAKRKKLVTQ